MKRKFSKKPGSNQGGFSLLEMIMATVIFLIIMSSIYGLLRIGAISKDTVSTRSDLTKNVRFAINAIGRDAINAGLGYNRIGGNVPDKFANLRMGIPTDTDNSRDLLTAIIAGNNLTESDFSINGEKNDVVSFAFRDLTFNAGKSIKLINSQESGGSVLVQTTPDTALNSNPFDLYLIESQDGKRAVGMVTAKPNDSSLVFGYGDPLRINQPYLETPDKRSLLVKCAPLQTANCINYALQVSAKKIFWVSYSVTTDGTLVRTSFGNNTGTSAAEQIQTQPLAFGISSFQVKYLLEDGTVTDDPSNLNINQERLNQVVQIEVKVAASEETFLEGVRQENLIKLTSTFSTRNLKYDVE